MEYSARPICVLLVGNVARVRAAGAMCVWAVGVTFVRAASTTLVRVAGEARVRAAGAARVRASGWLCAGWAGMRGRLCVHVQYW